MNFLDVHVVRKALHYKKVYLVVDYTNDCRLVTLMPVEILRLKLYFSKFGVENSECLKLMSVEALL